MRPEAVNSAPLHSAVSLTASYLCTGAVAHISFVAIRVRIFLSPAGREAVSVEAILLHDEDECEEGTDDSPDGEDECQDSQSNIAATLVRRENNDPHRQIGDG